MPRNASRRLRCGRRQRNEEVVRLVSVGKWSLRGGLGAGMCPPVRLLAIIALLFTGCSSMPKMKLPWNSRAAEQAKMNEATKPKKPRSEMTFEERLNDHDETAEFNPAAANFGSLKSYGTNSARTGGFYVKESSVRTKEFLGAGGFSTKEAWMNGMAYNNTKSAYVKESWFSRLTAPSKKYETREAPGGDKAAPVRVSNDADRSYLGKGRIQPVLDSHGREQIPFGTNDGGPSWNGEMKPLTIDDVKKLLNKGPSN